MERKSGFIGAMFAVLLAVTTLQAGAAQQIGRDFNHMTTGFPLSGGHAAAACETCHMGGVFKGTPRNCDGCHAVGQRVVATPKNDKHIVTDAPCESCHFNTATWLGARYNHGSAVSGQCRSCHNGRQASGKAGSHSSGKKATESCDSCHRTFAWFPASWNHAGATPGSCENAGCHDSSNQYNRASASSAILPSHMSYTYARTESCEVCHSVAYWKPARHMPQTGACSTCHNGTNATGKSPSHGYTTAECNTCHLNISTWQGASYHQGNVAGICGTCHNGTNGVKGTVNDPNGTHIPLTLGGNPNCDLCHTSTTTFTAYRMNHSGQTNCNTCHATTSPYVVATKRQLGNHQGSTTSQNCSDCHTSTTTWLGALGAKPLKHIPEGTAPSCSSCHTGTAVKSGSALHAYFGGLNCYTCHGSNTAYSGQGQKTARWPDFHERSDNPSAADCSASGCHKPAGNKGVLYGDWD